MARIVLAGYLVRNPLGGYAWQAAHYLLGLRALGHEAWFYEDTGHYAAAYNPRTNEFGEAYGYGIAATADFLARLGLGERWVFVDTVHGEEHGPGAGRAAPLVREADLLINLAGVNRIPPERRAGRPGVYIDIDPAFTQLKAAEGDALLRAILDEHAHLFTTGENIGTERSPVPTGGYTWHPTRQPVALAHWAEASPPGPAYTTVGKWDARGRDLVFRGEAFAWRKRTEWMRSLDLPARPGGRSWSRTPASATCCRSARVCASSAPSRRPLRQCAPSRPTTRARAPTPPRSRASASRPSGSSANCWRPRGCRAPAPAQWHDE